MHPEQEGAFRLDYILGFKPPVLTSLQHLGHLTGACERDTGALCVCEDAAGQKDANFVAWAAGTGGGNGRRQCYFYKIKVIYLDHCLKKALPTAIASASLCEFGRFSLGGGLTQAVAGIRGTCPLSPDSRPLCRPPLTPSALGDPKIQGHQSMMGKLTPSSGNSCCAYRVHQRCL